MIKELFVLKLFTKDKKHYDKFYTFLSTTNLDSEIKLLFSLIDSYYTDYPEHKYIGSSELINYFQLEYASYKDADAIIKVIEEVYRLEVSDSLIRDYLQQMLEKDTSTKIINKLLQVVDESKAGQLLTVKEDIAKYEELIKVNKQSDSIFVSNDLDELIEQEYEGDTINWRLKCLQEAAGPIREGLYHCYARPNVGKSSFLISEVTNFASQLKEDEDIIYFINEEKGNRIQLRLYSAMLNTPIDEIISNRQQAKDVFLQRGGGKIKVYDNAYISIEDIDRICNEYNPRIVVIDQGDKINFRGGAHLDGPIRLKELYRRFREQAKVHSCAVITAGQASAEAQGKKWLEMTHMDWSKCLAVGTPVLMFDGTWKSVEDITIGEQVMGPDGTVRNVLSTDSGISNMYKVTHTTTGFSYTVNENHILSLKSYSTMGKFGGETKNIPLTKYTKYKRGTQKCFRGYHSSCLEFPKQELPLDPYFLGAWLGDGSNRSPAITTADKEVVDVTYNIASAFGLSIREELRESYGTYHITCSRVNGKNKVYSILRDLNLPYNKHIPEIYKRSSIEDRLQIIAGLLDTDGSLIKKAYYEYFEFSNKVKILCEDLQQVCLSLGLRATLTSKIVKGETYYRVVVNGDLTKIPTKIPRKQSSFKAKERFNTSPIVVEALGLGSYAGFTLDGDHLYVIQNYIVTHNTGKAGEFDISIGIGKCLDDGKENMRYIHLNKNKFTGLEIKTPVLLNPLTGRYSDME